MLNFVGLIRINPGAVSKGSVRLFSNINRITNPILQSRPDYAINDKFGLAKTRNNAFSISGMFSMFFNFSQVRFKSRGNTYQPSTLKRKRTFGFLARLRSRNGKKVLARRRNKGRWYLTH